MTKRTALPILIAFTALPLAILGCSAPADDEGTAPLPFGGTPSTVTAPNLPQNPGNPASPGGAVAPSQTNEGGGTPGLVAPTPAGTNGGGAAPVAPGTPTATPGAMPPVGTPAVPGAGMIDRTIEAET